MEERKGLEKHGGTAACCSIHEMMGDPKEMAQKRSGELEKMNSVRETTVVERGSWTIVIVVVFFCLNDQDWQGWGLLAQVW